MQIFFLHHSAVCVVMDEALLVFDYFMGGLGDGMASGSISDDEIKSAKRVYVFVSHSHGDHFSRIIFDWTQINSNVTYLVDDTVSYTHESAVKMSRGETFDDGYLHAVEFGSTDIGGSFYVECEGKRLFHAGDLNYWHWRNEGDANYSRQMQLYFDREMKYLRANVQDIDYAFFPVDKRQGSGFDEGADMFIELMKPKSFVPIHFVDFADTTEFAAKHLNGDTKVFAVSKNGDKLL